MVFGSFASSSFPLLPPPLLLLLLLLSSAVSRCEYIVGTPMKMETGREKAGEEEEEPELEEEENSPSLPFLLPRQSDRQAAAGENPPATSTTAPAASGATSAFTRPWMWCHGRQL